MRKCETDRLMAELNSLNGKSYPEVGYYYFADVKGDGSNRRSVYQIINASGGVSCASELNFPGPAGRCRRIRAAIEAARLRQAVEREAATVDANHHHLGRASRA